jgi:glucokinase
MMLIAETDLLVQRTLDLFAGFFGIVASDGCLTLGATGGCFVAGGVIPKLGTHFRREIFLDRFKAKGRFHQYLSHIPIKILLDSEAGLYGLQRALSTRSLARFSVRPQ